MAPGQVLFRSLDFPKQAEDFLDGMIRTQIDRLTPWPADDALFGWSSPSVTGQERIELTLAATSKQEIQPLVQLATGLGAESLAAFAVPAVANGTPTKIKIFDQSLRGAAAGVLDTPRVLRAVLLSSALAAVRSIIAVEQAPHLRALEAAGYDAFVAVEFRRKGDELMLRMPVEAKEAGVSG